MVEEGGDDIRRMAAARPFGVEGMDSAPANGRQRVFDKPGLVQGIAVQRHLNIHLVGNRQRAVNRGGRRAPVFVNFQADSAGGDLLAQGVRVRAVAFAEQANIDRQRIGGLQHAGDIPRPRCTGGGVGACRRPGAAADHRRHAGDQRLFRLLRADPVDMGVDPASGDDLPFGGDYLRRGANRDRYARLNVRISGFAHGEDPPVFDADIGLHDPPVIDNQRVGEHQIHTVVCGHLPLSHPVADHFSAAEFDLFTVDRQIVFHLDPQFSIGQTHPVAGGGAEHVRIGPA